MAGKWRAERETPCASNLRMMGTFRLSNEERRLWQVRVGPPRPLTAHSALGATGDAPCGLSRRTTSDKNKSEGNTLS
ncbi:MAG: hypothetical protein HYW27_02465 [Candidatus Aenigmarchaeota archaeon]|nr:hypothetical protein [Candidatus Aenigmarchaeota archaeon]